ncbi:hypothetical protein [Sphingopyxis sp.]|uniref:hypothetical protein n=1 Tax=Sphingopyxis sp. TaxID=1908224 RepID=UPI003D6CF8D9
MKKTFSDMLIAVVAFIAFSVATTTPAHAYLDGATVSMALQALTGAVASILLFGKIYWTKLKSVFKRQQD